MQIKNIRINKIIVKKLTKRAFLLLNTDIAKISLYIKKEVKERLDKSVILIIRFWLSLWGIFSRTYKRVKKPLGFVLLIIILLTPLFISLKFKSRIDFYLVRQNLETKDKLSMFFSTFFVTVGAAVLGVLAIAFSLSLFALQQAVDKYTPTLLPKFMKDRTNRFIYLSIALISLLVFLFAVFPLNKLIFYEVILTFYFLLLIIYLLRKQYFHIANLINPIYQIYSHHNKAIRFFNKIDKWLNLMIRIGAIRPANNSGTKEDEKA